MVSRFSGGLLRGPQYGVFAPRFWRTRRAAKISAIVVIVLLVPMALVLAGPQTTFTVTCQGADDTSALQTAVNSAEGTPGSIVTIAPGTCALFNNINVAGPSGVTITGDSQATTILVQHARTDVFGIHAPGTTVENLTADTATFNTTVPPADGDPDPPTLFSGVSSTTVRDYTSISGTGFGIRLTGPNPCSDHTVSGDLIDTVNVTNQGRAGYSSIDVACNAIATITNATVNGGSVTPFQNGTTTVSGLTYAAGPYGITCEPAWQVTGGIAAISNVITSNGWGRTLGGADVTVLNESAAAGDTCPMGGNPGGTGNGGDQGNGSSGGESQN